MTEATAFIDGTEQDMLRDAARGFLAHAWPAADAVRNTASIDARRALWRAVAEQGWTALGSEQLAGTLADAVALFEELGRAAAPAPLIDAYLVNLLLHRAGAPIAGTEDVLGQLHAGTASIAFALGTHDPDDNTGGVVVRNGKASGELRFVEGLTAATHLLALTDALQQAVLIRLDMPGVQISDTPGLAQPPLARVRLEAVEATVLTPSLSPADSLALTRLATAARALGAATRGFELVVEHVKERKQFGKPVGSFQAIQHKLANCLTQLDACRLLIRRAAADADRMVADWQRGALAAFAFASTGLRQVSLETHHAFGAMSFWEEHEAPRHFRRIHSDLIGHGGVHAARQELAAVVLGSAEPRLPDIDLGPKANEFRLEVREWLAEHWSAEMRAARKDVQFNKRQYDPAFSRKLAEKGWLGLSWPKQWGGQGRSAFEQLAFEEEIGYVRAPVSYHSTAVNLAGPAIMLNGTPEQCEHFLPRILRGELSFCLGYSEPEAGSDLASLRTKATREGDEWVIQGSKLYTSGAEHAEYCWLAARTDATLPKHAGISVFIVPLKSPGVRVFPMQGLSGRTSTTVFYDEVRVPSSALIGEVNGGWKVITSALAFERVAMGGSVAYMRDYFDTLSRHLVRTRRNGLIEDPVIRDRIGQLAAEIEAARMLVLQSIAVVQRGGLPVHEAAVAKAYAGELQERLAQTALDILGPAGALSATTPGAAAEGIMEFAVRDALMYVIGGGTNEIQRNIVALRGLHLPH